MNINNENNLLNKKIIYDITKFSHLDYPNHLSCIIWFNGCNMRCDYCYNKDIVFSKKGEYSTADVLSFLKKRIGLLDGVVLSGGEATTHNLIKFCQEIKKLGFKIKLDTNGVNHKNIVKLLELDLIDYIALDYKAPKHKFHQITHLNTYNIFENTLEYLIEHNVNFEVRTTIHNDLLNEKDINIIIEDLVQKGYKNTYFLQNFLETDTNIGNISASSNNFDKSLLSTSLNIEYR